MTPLNHLEIQAMQDIAILKNQVIRLQTDRIEDLIRVESLDKRVDTLEHLLSWVKGAVYIVITLLTLITGGVGLLVYDLFKWLAANHWAWR